MEWWGGETCILTRCRPYRFAWPLVLSLLMTEWRVIAEVNPKHSQRCAPAARPASRATAWGRSHCSSNADTWHGIWHLSSLPLSLGCTRVDPVVGRSSSLPWSFLFWRVLVFPAAGLSLSWDTVRSSGAAGVIPVNSVGQLMNISVMKPQTMVFSFEIRLHFNTALWSWHVGVLPVSFLQTRSLLGVFEEDAAAISNYINQLFQAMHRIYDAQVVLMELLNPL